MKQDGEELPVIVGTPLEGERIGGELFDGNRKTAIFPGDLPRKPDSFFKAVDSVSEPHLPEINIVRFRPPLIEESDTGIKLSLPHIRLDRAMDYLLGDRLA